MPKVRRRKSPVGRNPFLTDAMERCLKYLYKHRDDDNLVAEGREIWYGDVRTNVALLYRLLRLCLIKECNFGSDERLQHYSINEDGIGVLKSQDYIPKIVKAMIKRLKKN